MNKSPLKQQKRLFQKDKALNNHILANVDTDAFSVCKPDQSKWTADEKKKFRDFINSQFPELIRWSDDGEYEKFLVVKSKNYVMLKKLPDGSVKKIVKGSAFKDSKKPKAMSQYMMEMVDLILDEKFDELVPLYERYAKSILNITDISPWAKKLTVTGKITSCVGHEKMDVVQKSKLKVRLNETKVYDAIQHTDFQEGDKIYLYFRSDKTYKLASEFDGDYDQKALLTSLYNTTQIFKKLPKDIFDLDKFVNYSLKRNRQLLESL
jgi:DNA polymerase elongation subunit (family B)